MGGHAAGEVASRIGVDTIIATFSDEPPPDTSLHTSFIAANTQIYSEGHGSMGTTGVAALFLGSTLIVANVGDSRAYLVRDGQIAQISRDHSFVSDQVAAGLMTSEQARTSNVRNIITRALGYQPEVQVDLFRLPMLPGDTVLLSSDGMHGLIDDSEIAEVASMLPPDQAVQRLVDTANARGGPDNITVVIAQVDEVDLVAPASPDLAQTSAATLARQAPVAAAPVAERPLSRLGMLLAALTLAVLIGAAGYVLANPPAVSAPTAAPTAASPAAPTASPPTTPSTPNTTTPTP
jgi:protein phosphatase